MLKYDTTHASQQHYSEWRHTGSKTPPTYYTYLQGRPLFQSLTQWAQSLPTPYNSKSTCLAYRSSLLSQVTAPDPSSVVGATNLATPHNHPCANCTLHVTVNPHVTLTSGVRKLQDLAQKIHMSEEAQEEAETLVFVAGLVSSRTLPWQETSAGRSQQIAHGGPQSRRRARG